MILTGQIKVERRLRDKREVHQLVEDHLKQGKLLGIFPEGTRSPDPEKMLPAFSGVARYAVKNKVPVIPVGVKGTFEIQSRHESRPKFFKNVEIIVGHQISFEQFHEIKLNKIAYHILTDKVMHKISELSEKHYEHAGVEKHRRRLKI